ncbi:60S large subunit ribosomal protein eL14 (rpL14) [Andalucia godoyi]|uniref:60S large subunit ribosomal protein eL14 (RpL14) n=1 Tax=Andalucia godoyi TaxID=505711 RepID=A0A8K0F1A2_ANDGO|nr:60S large subunit ribosomal protein eL14 (rpL14) [Andalucia godoyi]|eukprot:ANDGO_05426.mRNA.1 60S large subunit ribosomal protein eL14 (rpL14)
MTYSRFIEIGRLVVFTNGDNTGKVATIIDIVDSNRVIVDGPLSGVNRQVVNLRECAVTDLKTQIPRNIGFSTLKDILTKEKTVEKWNASAWAAKISNRDARANLNDFGRFKVMVARKTRAAAVQKEFVALKKKAKL